MANVLTPLRYPGGKTKLYKYVSNLITLNNMTGCTYVEPFAGGAGLAIKLLLSGIVKNIVLNDIDFAIYSIWDLILNHTDVLCDFIDNVPLNVNEWQKQRVIYNNQTKYTQIEVGLAAFYLNRTNISGVLTGGVIGGLSQNGKYKIDARFNREELIKKVVNIAKHKECIDLYNWNAVEFILNILPNYDHCFVYFDPPYVNKAPRLYRDSFTLEDHKYLAEIISACQFKWIVTYDECDFIKTLYKDFEYEIIPIPYSAGQTKKVGNEMIIFSSNTIH
jgi:DNA adenine methylase